MAGDWDEQQNQLEKRRQQAVPEMLQIAGVENLIRFAESVEHPEEVGYALGIVGSETVDDDLLPKLLDCKKGNPVYLRLVIYGIVIATMVGNGRTH